MNCAHKILSPEAFPRWRQQWRDSGRRLAVTNGCFDLLHAGHVTYLEAARNHADGLLVGVNSDAAVRQLKGSGRPVNPETDRALVVAALESVDGVFVFRERDAVPFLQMAHRVFVFRERDAVPFLQMAHPDIYVKGGDYTLETINQDERRFIESIGGEIVLLAHVPGKSTTGLLKKLAT